MLTWVYSRFSETSLAALVLSALMVGNCPAQERKRPSVAEERTSVKVFLQRYIAGSLPSEDDHATRYSLALTRLNSVGRGNAIVYLSGGGWCGTGGCTTLILSRDGTSWRVVTKIAITRVPIRVLNDSHDGWRSIGVWVGGGGIRPGYEAELDFAGGTYPTNPSVPPARRLDGQSAGEVKISSGEEMPLFP